MLAIDQNRDSILTVHLMWTAAQCAAQKTLYAYVTSLTTTIYWGPAAMKQAWQLTQAYKHHAFQQLQWRQQLTWQRVLPAHFKDKR